MTIASLVVDIGTNIGGLVKGVEQVHGQMNKVASGAEQMHRTLTGVASAAAAAFSFQEVAAAADKVVGMAGHIDDLAKKAGISAEAVQELDFAAKQSGSSFDAVARGLAQMSKHLVDGDKGTVAGLSALGLELDALRSMAPDQAFQAIAGAITEIEDPMLRSKLAMELFGKAGADMLPLLTSDIAGLRDRAKETGLVISNELVAAGDELGDSWDEMQMKLQALQANAMLPLLELFLKLPEPLQTITGLVLNLAPAFSNIGIAIMAAGGPMAALSALSGAFSALLPFLGPVGWIAAGVTAVFLAWKHWDTITGIVSGVYTAVRTWLVDKMQTIWKFITDGIDTVTTGFKRMYDLVVGNSYVPDMIEGIAREFGRLQETMVDPTANATSLVGGLFGALSSFVGDKFGPSMQRTVNTFQDIWKAGRGGLQGIMKLMTSDFSGFMSGILAGIEVMKMAWKGLQRLFGGGEEGVVVNPMRDTFLSQFGGPGTGEGSGFHTLAALLTSLGKGAGGGPMFAALIGAETEAAFRSAAGSIVDFITQAGGTASMNFHSGGLVPGTGEMHARLLGGERVQSRQEVSEFRQMLGEMRGLRTDLIRMVSEMPGQATAAAQIRRGLGVSYVG